MYKFKIIILMTALALLLGCSSRKNVSPLPTIEPKTKAELKKPVNCNTARRDLKVLENERASVGKQALSGVRMIMPISAVAGILMGDYNDRVEVATGQYNEDIDKKMAQIKSACNIR